MLDYHELLQRRIAVFNQLLQEMVRRRADEDDGDDCGITFNEYPPGSDHNRTLGASRVVTPALALAGTSAGATYESGSGMPGEPGPAREPESNRFVQFSFERKTFAMDLPKQTLWPGEARLLIARRSGFFWVRDRKFPNISAENLARLVEDFDPVAKEYLNADTLCAAEDMAYVFYTLWKFPVDWQFYRRCMRFRKRRRRAWEGDGPVP